MDGPCLSTRVEFHFIEKKRDGWGKGREEEMMELELGGGVLSEAVSPSLTLPHPLSSSEQRRSKISVVDKCVAFSEFNV